MNYNKHQAILFSTLLAQKKLSEGGGSNNNGGFFSNMFSIIGTKDNIIDKPQISDRPNFNLVKEEQKYDDFSLPLQDVLDALARKAKSVYERYLISEDGRELIAKATEYKIPFNIRKINFLELRDKVEEYEEAIEKAAEYGIDWKEYGYDLVGIEQEISESKEAEHNHMQYTRESYLTTRGVGA